mmetsp:Transcript_22242/g.49762  ORF Transcript_22242/g.49762 Transcript_22242/m.49762 type:complete len:296 (+) Transcript_22242:151-1038(+)
MGNGDKLLSRAALSYPCAGEKKGLLAIWSTISSVSSSMSLCTNRRVPGARQRAISCTSSGFTTRLFLCRVLKCGSGNCTHTVEIDTPLATRDVRIFSRSMLALTARKCTLVRLRWNLRARHSSTTGRRISNPSTFMWLIALVALVALALALLSALAALVSVVIPALVWALMVPLVPLVSAILSAQEPLAQPTSTMRGSWVGCSNARNIQSSASAKDIWYLADRGLTCWRTFSLRQLMSLGTGVPSAPVGKSVSISSSSNSPSSSVLLPSLASPCTLVAMPVLSCMSGGLGVMGLE